MVAAAIILALTTTSGRLFLASTGDAAIAQEFKRIGGVPALATVAFGADGSEMAAVEAEVESVVRDQAPELGPSVRSMVGPTLDAVAGARTAQVRLAARDGFDAHLQVLDRTADEGVWLTDTTARLLGVRAGQTVRLGGPSGIALAVAGIYRDLAAGGRPLDPFWSPLASIIYTLSADRDTPARCCWSTRTGSSTWPTGSRPRAAWSGTSTRSLAGRRCRGRTGWRPRSGRSSRPLATPSGSSGGTGSRPARRSPPPSSEPMPPRTPCAGRWRASRSPDSFWPWCWWPQPASSRSGVGARR